MARLRKSLWTIAAVAALPASAAAREPVDVCAALQRLAAAAREPSPFASIDRALAAGETVVPGFRADDCGVASGALSCGTQDFVAANFDGWPRPLTCAGLTASTPLARRWHRDRAQAYVLRGLRIEYGISCMGCAGGANSHFEATVEPRRRPDD